MRSLATSSRRWTICPSSTRRRSSSRCHCEKREARLLRFARNDTLQRVLVVDRRDRAAPGPMEFRQQLLGRGAAARDELVERIEMARLVAALRIEAAAALEPLVGDREGLRRQIEQTAPADRRAKPQPRHVVAQLLPLLGGPVLDDVPGGVERSIVVEQSDPERRQRRQAQPTAGGGAGHLEVAVEPPPGEER